MKISINSPYELEKLNKMNGFGYATDRMVDAFSVLGYEWGCNLKDADVEIAFDQPHNVFWKIDSAYKIMYVPWESTSLPGFDYTDRPWLNIMNSADEVWTPSPLIAEWFKAYMGVTRPIYVYEHGVDPIWTPKERVIEDKFKFLHVGMEALRKGGADSIKAFRKAFPNNNDVEITFKTIPSGWKVGWLRNINVIDSMFTIPDLVKLFHNHHAYVYPSYGEGFGLTPLQAMATGMPTITVPAWAPYQDFIDPNLAISSQMIASPWPRIHPGMMLEPKLDDIVDSMRYAYSNYDSVQAYAQEQVTKITEKYDWVKLTEKAFLDLEKRLVKF